MKLRKKQIEVNAFQWTGDSDELWVWLRDECGVKAEEVTSKLFRILTDDNDGPLIIRTLEGDHRADLGDWIIQGVKGEFYPCKPDIKELTYDEVER